MTAALTLAADLVESVAAQDRTAAEALALLDAHGLTVDREQLSEAVALVHLHRLYEQGQGNPYDLLGTDGPIPARHSISRPSTSASAAGHASARSQRGAS